MPFLAAIFFSVVFQLPTANSPKGILWTAFHTTVSLCGVTPNGEPDDLGNSGSQELRGTHKKAKMEAPTQTFTGIVEWEYKPLAWDCQVPNCDHFALYDDAAKTNYELDDARKALPFEGKRAKVTGVVNTKDHIIHVISVEALK